MKTWLLLLTGSVLLALGYVLGARVADSSAVEAELRQRIAALEERTALPATRDTISAVADQAHADDPGRRGPEIQLQSAQRALAERIARLERQGVVPPGDRFQAKSSEPEGSERELIAQEILEQAFAILQHAEANATLDQSMQEELNQVLPEMDRRTNKEFWQRFFADLDDGRIELPEVDHPDDGWLGGYEAAEVSRESYAW